MIRNCYLITNDPSKSQENLYFTEDKNLERQMTIFILSL